VRPYLKKTHHTHTTRAGGVAQDVDPEFKPQYCKQQQQKPKESNRNVLCKGMVFKQKISTATAETKELLS
jgi:hypothetical protein